MKNTTIAARFAAIIARATGVTLNTADSMPAVVGDEIRFFTPIDDGAVIVEAIVGIHGVDPGSVSVSFLDADAFEVPSCAGATDVMISLSINALASRLATLQAA